MLREEDMGSQAPRVVEKTGKGRQHAQDGRDVRALPVESATRRAKIILRVYDDDRALLQTCYLGQRVLTRHCNAPLC